MGISICLSNLTQWDWTAIGTLSLAIGAFVTLFAQKRQFQKLRADENERNFKNSSITLITKFDKDFNKIEDCRFEVSQLMLQKNMLDPEKFDFKLIEYWAGDIFDFFDTLGFFVREEYLKPEVVHQYFYHWFSHYYEFYKLYSIKKASGYPETTWINLPTLSEQLDNVETNQLGKKKQTISKAMLKKFFEEEAWDEER
jgi:hypothetical protein